MKKVRIIGIPMDLGQQHRGVDMGPIAIRYAGLAPTLQRLGYQTRDHGNIQIPGHYTLREGCYPERLAIIEKACAAAYHAARQAIAAGTIPVFLGGDHSSSIGSIGGVTHAQECGLIWLDAHGDFNTPKTSETGNVHGMALAILMGYGPEGLVNTGRKGPKLKPENVVLIGVRELDRKEKKNLKKAGIKVFTMRDIDEQSMHGVLSKTLARLAKCKRIHLSLDMDALDPHEAPGVGTPVYGGISYREAQLLMETLCDTGKLCALDIMETNPILDQANQTAQVAVSLTASLFGKSII